MTTDLEHFSDLITHTDEYIFNVMGYSFRRRYVAFGPSGFHEGTESTIINGLECPFAFRNPTDELGTDDINFRYMIIC